MSSMNLRFLALICALLAACGQSGALYLPEDAPEPVAVPAMPGAPDQSEKEDADEGES